MSADKILISGIRCAINVGIDDQERNQKQECAIDLEIRYDVKEAGESDDLRKSLNYAEIISKTVKWVEHHEFHLIEKIAEQVAGLILREYPAEKVKVRVKKLNPPINRKLDFVAVEITRKTNE